VTTLCTTVSSRDQYSQLLSSLRCLGTSSDSERSSAHGLTSSEAGGHLTPTSYSSDCRLRTLLERETDRQTERVTFRLAVYRQSVRLCVEPLEPHDQRLFSTEPLRSYPLCNNLSDEKMGLSLMYVLGLSSSVRIAHRACYWKFLLLHCIHVLCQSRLCKADHGYLMLPQRQLSHLNGRKFNHRQI
jgi:hypothetical protein